MLLKLKKVCNKITDVTHKVQSTAIFVVKSVCHTVKVQRTDILPKQCFGALHLTKHCLGNFYKYFAALPLAQL